MWVIEPSTILSQIGNVLLSKTGLYEAAILLEELGYAGIKRGHNSPKFFFVTC